MNSAALEALFHADNLWPALAALALATLISEDLTCIAAGLLVAAGKATFWPVTAACFVGIFVGDLLLVAAGRTAGRRSLTIWPLRQWISAEGLVKAERWFEQRGGRVVMASRFLPGTRLPTFLAAGILKAPWVEFTGWFALACALWTPLLVGTAAACGQAALVALQAWSRAVPILAAAGVLSWLLIKLVVQASSWRGRRLLYARWQRLTRWEFWPAWAVYPPVVAYILWLGLRYRSPFLFTAVNPGIAAGGGLVGESKSAILRGLTGAGGRIATWSLIEPGAVNARVQAVRAFMEQAGLQFPIVLKPDVGERGTGVVIARSETEVAEKLQNDAAPMIAQAYVPGVEFGVFYYRIPSAPMGEILAITDKRVVRVIGDGVRSLEALILADQRAVCMARFFLRTFAAELERVPALGESVTLAELGTHCRGALFLDGSSLTTPALRQAIESVSRTFQGYYFGRYDVRTPSAEALAQGEFTVIELNGLTSEATSIYDPKHSLWFGWQMLCRQWRIAFAIADENRAEGVAVLSAKQVLALLNKSGV